MTPTSLVNWCEANGLDPTAVDICLAMDQWQAVQVVTEDNLTIDSDGDVVINQ